MPCVEKPVSFAIVEAANRKSGLNPGAVIADEAALKLYASM
jgi:hypothetical protein